MQGSESGGEWISSIDMENEIMAHPSVLEASVVGVPHPKWEERPLALVVLGSNSDGQVTEEEIKRHLSNKYAKWQLPDTVLFVAALPKTSVGKFDKKKVRSDHQNIYMAH
jgi:fatty-acyl-CoA synthase